MRKVAIGILFSAITLLLSAAFFMRHSLACELLPVMNYQQIGGGVFLAADISKDQAESLQRFVALASARIANVYGTPISKPRILITSNVAVAAKWGANETASMHRMPWRSCIVIGPKGQNIDVIAHEWLHAEIQQRVGFHRFLKEMPVWFDEGAALTVDYRAPFLPENINLAAAEIQDVTGLSSASAFFSGNIRKNYQAAKLAVEPLILKESFFDDLEQISAGKSFASVFLKANKNELSPSQ